MSDEDWWPRWYRRRGYWPFMRRWPFEDVDDLFKEMDEFMKREFEEFSKKAPKDLVRERMLPNGTRVKEWGPFVYGYSVTLGPEGKPQIRVRQHKTPSKIGQTYHRHQRTKRTLS